MDAIRGWGYEHKQTHLQPENIIPSNCGDCTFH